MRLLALYHQRIAKKDQYAHLASRDRSQFPGNESGRGNLVELCRRTLKSTESLVPRGRFVMTQGDSIFVNSTKPVFYSPFVATRRGASPVRILEGHTVKNRSLFIPANARLYRFVHHAYGHARPSTSQARLERHGRRAPRSAVHRRSRGLEGHDELPRGTYNGARYGSCGGGVATGGRGRPLRRLREQHWHGDAQSTGARSRTRGRRQGATATAVPAFQRCQLRWRHLLAWGTMTGPDGKTATSSGDVTRTAAGPYSSWRNGDGFKRQDASIVRHRRIARGSIVLRGRQ